ncbi:hypothetical protein GY45DRAFT_701281 [Cubamyces sp. BRFM 1775]|nr:hypothetical protein GY45DRAFT_701281 [Cubamyces sp. BRFM 1775]
MMGLPRNSLSPSNRRMGSNVQSGHSRRPTWTRSRARRGLEIADQQPDGVGRRGMGDARARMGRRRSSVCSQVSRRTNRGRCVPSWDLLAPPPASFGSRLWPAVGTDRRQRIVACVRGDATRCPPNMATWRKRRTSPHPFILFLDTRQSIKLGFFKSFRERPPRRPSFILSSKGETRSALGLRASEPSDETRLYGMPSRRRILAAFLSERRRSVGQCPSTRSSPSGEEGGRKGDPVTQEK